MKPYFIIFGREIPIYGICFYIGIFTAAAVALLICKKRNTAWYDVAYSGVYIMIGAVLGSKLLFIAVSLRQIITENIPFEAVLKGGFVFYGGLIGGIAGLLIYQKQFHMKGSALSETVVSVLPLGHAFGRVGCFFAGCCYGIEYDGPFSHTYHYSYGNTPIGTPLLPIQLIEAFGLLIIFSVLLTLYLKSKRSSHICAVSYLIMYPTLRFTLEFFRGDAERGTYWLFSTSQWISLATILGVIFYLIVKNLKRKRVDKSTLICYNNNGEHR